MKKLLLLCIPFLLLADTSKMELKLIENLVSLLSTENSANIYIQDPKYLKIKNLKSKLNITPDCTNANFLIIENSKNISKTCFKENQIIVVTNYRAYTEDEDTLGAIFWQKGRLNMIFRSDKLKKLSINLPPKYDMYIE